MKTALSIAEESCSEDKNYAKEQHYSRSEVFVIAVKEFLKKLESKRLLDALNDAYSEVESPEEKTLREKSKEYYVSRVLRNNIDN